MNGIITRLILTFAGSSMAFTLLPLLESGNGAPLIAVLDRERSLVVYAAFLVLFAAFVLPAFLAMDHERARRWPWVAVVGYVMVFAAIPLIFTAYISGVSVHGLVPIGALCAMAMGVPLALRRCLGPQHGSLACSVAGALLLFGLPGVALYLESVGRTPPSWIAPISIPHWLHRFATLREVPESPWPFMVCMIVPWAIGAGSLGRSVRRAAATSAIALALGALPGWMTADTAAGPGIPARAPAIKVQSLVQGVGRPGLRTPLAVTLPAGPGSAVISAGVDAVRVPRDGATHRILLVPAEGARRLRVVTDDGVVEEVPLPVTLIEDRVLVAVLGSFDVENGVLLDPDALPTEHGALEAFGVIVVAPNEWERLTPPRREALLRWTALGGRLVREHPTPDVDRAVGAGRDVSLTGGALFPATPAFQSTALDGELTRTFEAPDWQKKDLSDLLWFAAVYHLAFLAAFLLPLLLDSRKAPAVYLMSVGFVVLVVAGFAWQVLGEIFLKDNQVYTHAITVMVADDGPSPRVASRQFLSFASMSSEDRSLKFAEDADLVVYQSPFTPRNVVRRVDPDAVVLEDVHLDRYRHKLVVRVDREAPLPLALDGDPRSATGVRLAFREGVPDTLGLREATVDAAWQVESGRITRRLAPSGDRLVPAADGAAPGLPPEVHLHVRKLLGHFAPARDSWLLVRWADLPRADEARDWLWSRDLGGWLLLPL